MQKNKKFFAVLICLLLFAGVTGCAPETRYRVLTFFFTGVPPLHGPSPAELAAQEAASAAQRAKSQPTQAELDRLAALKPFTGPYVHGPYAADDCSQCHEMAEGGFSFGNSDAVAKKSIVPGQFVRTPVELCVACHTSKSSVAAQAAGLRLHGPAWLCTNCHQPHSSRQRYLLKTAAGKLCLQCHGAGFIQDTELHAGLTDCLECHNPHLGMNARMLRDDFEEVF